MSDPKRRERFEELDAARALGDLSAAEHREWTDLIEEHGFAPDLELDLLVAGLDSSLSESSAVPSPELIDKLEADTARFMPLAAETPQPVEAEVIPFWKHPALGWAAAACFALGLWVASEDPVTDPTLAEQRQALIGDEQAVQLAFAGTENFAEVQGDIVWTDEAQTGFMRFRGLPANDPTEAQYQLWIVDPERDERPVDGGVFDIPAGGGEVVVPIRAALRVDEPVAFVITVEKPGGVVVSKQEIVAAIAARG